jgi:AraC family transcriptional activator of pobA
LCASVKPAHQIPSYNYHEFRNRFTESEKFPVGGTEAFRIYKIQEVIQYTKFPLPLQRSGYFEILFVTAGASSSRHCGLRKYEINPRQIFFKAAGQISSGDISDTNIEGYFVLLQGDFLSNHGISNTLISSLSFFKYGHSPLITLSNDESNKFDHLFHTIHGLLNDAGNNHLIAAYINVVLQEANVLHQKQENIIPSNAASSQERLVSTFLDLIGEHYLHKQQVHEYAELLFVTPNYLNKAVKQVTGKTALGQIHDMLVMEAKVLLKQRQMNISEVADYLSFEGPSYFARFFKKHTGCTPLDYRKTE